MAERIDDGDVLAPGTRVEEFAIEPLQRMGDPPGSQRVSARSSRSWWWPAVVGAVSAGMLLVAAWWMALPSAEDGRRGVASRLGVGNTAEDTLAGERGSAWWSFEGAEGQVVRVMVWANAFRPTIGVFSETGEALYSMDEVASPFDDVRQWRRGIFSVPAAGRYLVRIAGGIGDYEVTTSTVETVAALASGVPARGDYGSDELLWSFHGDAGQVVVLTATPSTEDSGFFRAYLLSPEGRLIDLNEQYAMVDGGFQDTYVVDGARVIRSLSASGEYRVLVGGLNGYYGTPSSYEVTMRVVQGANTLGMSSTGYGVLDSRQDVDLWELGGNGQPVVVRVEGRDPWVIGTHNEADYDLDGHPLVALAPVSEPLKVLVTSNMGENSFRYNPEDRVLDGRYEVTARPFEQARRLQMDSVARGEGEGVWSFEGRAGQLVGISLFGRSENPTVSVYSPAGEQVLDGRSTYFGADFTGSARLPVTGLYLLSVDDNGPYRLWIGDMGEGRALAMGSSARGVLSGVRGWQDLRRFRCEVGRTVTARVSLAGRDVEYPDALEDVEFYSASGRALRSGYFGGDRRVLCSEGGDHWVVVTAMRSGFGSVLDLEDADGLRYDMVLDAVDAMPLEAGVVNAGYVGDEGVNVWSLRGEAGEVVDLAFSRAVSGARGGIRWTFESGEVLSLSGSEEGRVLPYSGRYFITVGGVTGAYQVVAQVSRPFGE